MLHYNILATLDLQQLFQKKEMSFHLKVAVTNLLFDGWSTITVAGKMLKYIWKMINCSNYLVLWPYCVSRSTSGNSLLRSTSDLNVDTV